MAKAPIGPANPSPPASTSPGNEAAATACAKNASPRSTIHVPRRPPATARNAIWTRPCWTNGSWNGSSTAGHTIENESQSHLEDAHSGLELEARLRVVERGAEQVAQL